MKNIAQNTGQLQGRTDFLISVTEDKLKKQDLQFILDRSEDVYQECQEIANEIIDLKSKIAFLEMKLEYSK